jgi:pimeloyl-ACP methyl ester carboxylesterase
VRADMLRLGVAGVIGHLRAQLAHDVRREAPRITAPTLLIAGENDPLTRSGAHLALQAALPQARLVNVPRAGHVTFLIHPANLARGSFTHIWTPPVKLRIRNRLRLAAGAAWLSTTSEVCVEQGCAIAQ